MKVILFLCIILTSKGFDPAKFTITKPGNRFQPADSVELLSVSSNVRSTMSCAILCYQDSLCRTFDFDSNSKQCRLFEGSFDTGSHQPNFSSTVIGWIKINPSMFDLYNATSDQCANSRFLDSAGLSRRCDCPIHTFWNGSMCLNQRFRGDFCLDNNWCRIDLSIHCVLSVSVCNGKIYVFTPTFSQLRLFSLFFPTEVLYFLWIQ